MAINFVTETGSGLDTATSYATVEQCRQYHTNIGKDYSTKTDEQIQAALNSATMYLDASYSYDGLPYTESQALAFPRYDIYDRNDNAVGLGTIPKEIISATCYLAGLVLEGVTLDQIDEGISSQSVAGISVSYSNGGIRTYPTVDRLVSSYIIPGARLRRVN